LGPLVLRQAVTATTAAAHQFALDGGQDKAAQSAELLNETRKKRYRLLAGDAANRE
jgi:hypothetical protein